VLPARRPILTSAARSRDPRPSTSSALLRRTADGWDAAAEGGWDGLAKVPFDRRARCCSPGTEHADASLRSTPHYIKIVAARHGRDHAPARALAAFPARSSSFAKTTKTEAQPCGGAGTALALAGLAILLDLSWCGSYSLELGAIDRRGGIERDRTDATKDTIGVPRPRVYRAPSTLAPPRIPAPPLLCPMRVARAVRKGELVCRRCYRTGGTC